MSLDFDTTLLEKYDAQIPRYTSYPTALQFNDEFSYLDYQQHAQASNNELLPRPLSLYIHIPFCHSLCYYCGCNKIVTQNKNNADTYLEYLFREIAMHSQHYAADRLVKQIHIGGGTPNFLSIAQFRELFDVIARHFHLSYPEDLEISIEIDPRYANAKEIRELANLGFNRFSIGVQDISTKVQKAVNRIQTIEQTETVIKTAKECGANSISVDLIYGLPFQTRDSFAKTLKKITEIGAERIAIYNFAYMPNRIPAQKLIDKADLPDRQTRTQILRDTIDYLTNSGYVHIGLDHFALPNDSLSLALKENDLHRSFQGYSTHAECTQIGLGLSAISQFKDAYSQNISSLPNYYACIDAGKLPIQRGTSLSEDDLIRAHLIQNIMCQHNVQFSQIESLYSISISDYFKPELIALEQIEKDKLIKYHDDGFYITDNGRFFLRNIAKIFDIYLIDSGREQNVVRFSNSI